MELIKDITCHQAVALVSDYLEGSLSRRDRRRLERHLKDCDACSAYLDQMRVTIALADQWARTTFRPMPCRDSWMSSSNISATNPTIAALRS